MTPVPIILTAGDAHFLSWTYQVLADSGLIMRGGIQVARLGPRMRGYSSTSYPHLGGRP